MVFVPRLRVCTVDQAGVRSISPPERDATSVVRWPMAATFGRAAIAPRAAMLLAGMIGAASHCRRLIAERTPRPL